MDDEVYWRAGYKKKNPTTGCQAQVSAEKPENGPTKRISCSQNFPAHLTEMFTVDLRITNILTFGKAKLWQLLELSWSMPNENPLQMAKQGKTIGAL